MNAFTLKGGSRENGHESHFKKHKKIFTLLKFCPFDFFQYDN